MGVATPEIVIYISSKRIHGELVEVLVFVHARGILASCFGFSVFIDYTTTDYSTKVVTLSIIFAENAVTITFVGGIPKQNGLSCSYRHLNRLL